MIFGLLDCWNFLDPQLMNAVTKMAERADGFQICLRRKLEHSERSEYGLSDSRQALRIFTEELPNNIFSSSGRKRRYPYARHFAFSRSLPTLHSKS